MISLLDAAVSGVGVYTISEAARYAKMSPSTLRTWFFPSGGREPMRRGEIESDGQKAISFLDFVEALAARSLRVDYNVAFKTIREGIEFARTTYGVDYPFARRDHKTVLVGNQLYIFLKDDPTRPVGLTGKHAGQKAFRECIEPYMKDLSYDETGMANLYTAYRFGDQRIVMDPRTQFGEPIILENGFPADVLWQAAVAEGSFERAAELYDVRPEAVEAAYRYCNGELSLQAA